MLDLEIKIIKTETPKDKPTDESTLGFGKLFTDHMFIVEYTEGIGWHEGRQGCFLAALLRPRNAWRHR